MAHSIHFYASIIMTAVLQVAASPPACGNEDVGVCTCPPGTDFQNAVTYAILGVNVKDFMNVTADFFNTDWVDTHLNSTEGEDNMPGSTRSFGIEITEGIYPFTEELLAFDIEPDGSFTQRVGQFNIPVEYSFKNGSLSGIWVTLKADYAAQYETAVNWSLYACFTGYPISFVDFMTSGINNAISVLNSKGLAKGQTLGPFTVQSF